MMKCVPSSPVKELTFVAFDIETTGLEPVLHRIVEIAGVKFRANRILNTFETLINPQMPIPEETIQIHGITDAMVQNQPPIDQVLPDFLDFLNGSIPVAHNAPFDASFLSYDFSRLQLKPDPVPVLDTCALSRVLFPGLRKHSLEYLARHFHLIPKTLHRALSDAEICMKIFWHCVRKIGDIGKVKLNKVIHFNRPVYYFNPEAIQFEGPLQLIEEAFRSGGKVEIVYKKSSGEMTTRTITPLTFGTVRHSIVIEAFCHLRNEKRTFRIDRIVEVRTHLS